MVHGDATGALFLASARRGAPPRPGGRAGRQTDTWPPPDAAFAVPRTDEYKAELCAAPLARVRLGGGRGTLLKKIQTRPTPSQPFAWGVSRGGEVAGGRRGGSTAVFSLTPFRGWTVAPPRSTFACSCAARHKNVRVGCGSVVTHRVLCRQSTVMGTRRAVTLRGKQGRCAPPHRSGRLQRLV